MIIWGLHLSREIHFPPTSANQEFTVELIKKIDWKDAQEMYDIREVI
jgi:hypothetical protein